MEQVVALGCMAGIVVVGVLVIVRVIKLEELAEVVARFVCVVCSGFFAVLLVKVLVTNFVVPWLESLRNWVLWLLLPFLVVVMLGFMFRMKAANSNRRLKNSGGDR